jgi:hypothetical protein
MRSLSASLLLFAGLALGAQAFASDSEEEVRALEQQCEAAREAKLKPLRDAEIERCKQGGKDPDYCERYFRDLGNAVRLPNGKWRPRLFDDLPECQRAWEARRKLAMEGK